MWAGTFPAIATVSLPSRCAAWDFQRVKLSKKCCPSAPCRILTNRHVKHWSPLPSAPGGWGGGHGLGWEEDAAAHHHRGGGGEAVEREEDRGGGGGPCRDGGRGYPHVRGWRWPAEGGRRPGGTPVRAGGGSSPTAAEASSWCRFYPREQVCEFLALTSRLSTGKETRQGVPRVCIV